jgi:hypothetical protein
MNRKTVHERCKYGTGTRARHCPMISMGFWMSQGGIQTTKRKAVSERLVKALVCTPSADMDKVQLSMELE